MTRQEYKLSRDRAVKELQALLHRRAKLDTELRETNTRIEEVTTGVNALNLLVGDAVPVNLMVELTGLNLSEAVRGILKQSESHLTALDIFRTLRELRYPLFNYTNPQASIHTILRRLEESGLADTILKDGKTAYRLIPEE